MQNQQLKFIDVFKYEAFKEYGSSTDGILRVEDGTEFRINRNILAQRCPYFKALFFGGFADGTDVTLREISAETLDTILVYLYTKMISLTKENALDLLFASDYFLIDTLRQKSKSFLLSKMSIDDCIPLFRIAWYFKTLDIFNDCRRLLVFNFEKVVSTSKQIGSIPLEALKSVLIDRSLNVSEERMVWNVIVRWVNHDKPGRLRFVPELLKCISFDDLDGPLINGIVSKDIVKGNSFCRELIFAKRKNTSGVQNFRQILNSQSLMKGSRIPTNLHLIVQYSEANKSNIYLTCDGETDYWRMVGSIDFFPDYLVQLDRYIYMFDSFNNKSVIFDVLDEKCLFMPPIPEEPFYSVVAVNGFIYIFGYDTPMAFVFHPRLRKWKPFEYDKRMCVSASAAMNNQIYVVGTSFLVESYNLKESLHFKVYNFASKSWSDLKEQPFNFGEVVLIPFKGQLFYIGNVDAESVYSTMEKYDPLKNTWSRMPNLPVSYKFARAVVFKDVLIVYEEKSFEGSAPPTYWDSDNQTWHIIDESSPLHMIHKYRFCTVTEPNIIKEIVKRNRGQGIGWIKSCLA